MKQVKNLYFYSFKAYMKPFRLLLCLLAAFFAFSFLPEGFSEDDAFYLPSDLRIIKTGAFMNNSGIKKLIIPDLTETIGPFAFSGASDLTEVHISKSVREIKDSAFENCPNLKKVVIESDLTVVEDNAFSYCAPDLIIYGYTNASLVKVYADQNKITFIPMWVWSDWTTTKPSQGSQSQEKTQYRSRSLTTQTVYSDWSDWISNGKTAISATELREVRTIDHPAVTKTVYKYNRYKYKNASGSTYLSYSDGYANANGFSGAWEYTTSDTKLPNYKVYDGSHQAYGTSSSFWFNETKSTQTVTAAYTEYQYRTRTTSEETVYTSWSAWGDSYIAPSSSVQVETRTLYRTLEKASDEPGESDHNKIADGMYILKNASGKALSVKNMQNAENASIITENANGGNGQKFILTSQGDGFYLIQIYDGPAVTFSNKTLRLSLFLSGNQQKWRFVPAGDNSFYIESGNFGYLASASDGSTLLTDSFDDADIWTLSSTLLASPSVGLDSYAAFTIGNITETSASFTWTDLVGVDSYKIHIARGGETVYTAADASSGYTYSSLSPNTTYTVRLEAVNTAGSGFTAVKTFTTKGNLPIVEFSATSITVNENLAFNVGVKVTNYNNKSLKISLNTTDPKLDIVETKFTGPNQTLKTLYNAGIIKLPGSGHSNTADLQNTKNRTFYLSAKSGTLHIGGNYIRTSDTVTLTIQNPTDGSYAVGANNTCVIHYKDVDGLKPNKSSYSTKAAYVSACAAWLNAKFPSGKYWNHPVGTICDDDNITSVSCTTRTHGSDNTIYSTSCFTRGVVPGDSICTRFAHYSSAQCMGFALKVGYDIFGSSPMNTTYWTNLGATSSLQPGDYVRISGHSMFVLSVNGSKITTVECNRGANCIIHRNTRTVSGGYIDGSAIEQVRRIKNWK